MNGEQEWAIERLDSVQTAGAREELKAELVLKLSGATRTFFRHRELTELSAQNRWEPRWLVLTKERLAWAEERGKEPNNAIAPTEVTQLVIVEGRYLEKSFVLRVVTRKKAYLFALDSKETALEWAVLLSKLSGAQITKQISF